MHHHSLLQRLDLQLDEVTFSDGKLLDQFIVQRDEAAFAALVQRHGRMVQGVCRRLLGNRHDVEDAFQATFVVLVRKADSIKPREAVGNWLYGVAYNVAIKLRAVAARRQVRERQQREMAAEQPTEEASDLQAALDEELTRLPDRYRVPIVLCDLEGRSRKEVAKQLGWKEGTLSGRLSRGRALLAQRLKRHGVALSVGGLALALAAEARATAPFAQLARATTKGALASFGDGGLASGLLSPQALALADDVVKGLLLSKLKAMMVASFIGLVATGIGLMSVDLSGKGSIKGSPSLAAVQETKDSPTAEYLLVARQSAFTLDETETEPQSGFVPPVPRIAVRPDRITWIDLPPENAVMIDTGAPIVLQVKTQLAFTGPGPSPFELDDGPPIVWVLTVLRGGG